MAAVALPAYQDYIVRSKAVEFPLAATPSKTAMSEWAAFNAAATSWPASGTEAGILAASGGDYVSAVTYSDTTGPLVAAVRVTGSIDTKTITLEYQGTKDLSGGVTWVCAAVAGTKYLPASCRN